MPLVSGATAADFHVVRLLGRGQIGELYLVEHPRLPRQYALKILSADVSTDPEYRNQKADHCRGQCRHAPAMHRIPSPVLL